MISNIRVSRLLCVCLQRIFAITAIVLMWIASVNCNYIKFTDTSGTSEPISLEFGIWYVRHWSLVLSSGGTFVVESCQQYPDSALIDGSWKAARAFSIISLTLSILVLIGECAPSTDKPSRKINRAYEAALCLLAALSEGLTLLFLNSDACNSQILMHLEDKALEGIEFPETCALSTGGNLAISSMVFFFLAGATSLVANWAEEAAREEEEEAGLREPLTA